MKKGRLLLSFATAICAIGTLNNNVVQKVCAETKKVTYKVASISSVSGSAEGIKATFKNTYSTKDQLIFGKSMTLTLTGDYLITSLSMSMKSNTSKGKGSLKINDEIIIGDCAFNDVKWNGSYTTKYTDVNIDLSNLKNKSMQNGMSIVVSASENSLFVQSFTVGYEEAVIDESKINVTYELNGGSSDKNYNASIDKETIIQKPANPTKDGYVFDDWYVSNEEGAAKFDFTQPISSDTTIYAKWKDYDSVALSTITDEKLGWNRITGEIVGRTSKKAYMLQDGEKTVLVSDGLTGVKVGNTVTLTGNITKDDNSGLYIIAEAVNPVVNKNDETIETTPLTSLDDVTAENVGKYIVIDRIKLGERTATPFTYKIADSSLLVFASSPSVIKGLEEVYSNDLKGKTTSIKGVVQKYIDDLEIIPTEMNLFEEFTVTYDSNGGDAIAAENATVTVVTGDNAVRPEFVPTKAATSLETYEFEGWYTDKDCTQKYTFDTPVTSDITLYANWNTIEKPLSEIFSLNAKVDGQLSFGFTAVKGEEKKGKISFSNENIKGTGSSYTNHNGTIDGVKFESYYYINSGAIQVNNKGCFMKNTTALPGSVKSMTIEYKNSPQSIKVYGGSTKEEASQKSNLIGTFTDKNNSFDVGTEGVKYIYVDLNTSKATYINNIEISYFDAPIAFTDFTNMSLNFKSSFVFGDKVKGTDFEEAGMFFVQGDKKDEYKGQSAEALPEGASVAQQEDTTKDLIVRLEDIDVSKWSTKVTAVPYVKVDGAYYFGQAGCTSVAELAIAYSDVDTKITLSDGTIVALSDIAEAIFDLATA